MSNYNNYGGNNNQQQSNAPAEKQKVPMVQRYERQIWASPRDGKALSCAESLCAPPETDENKSPLEMHNSYSVFRMAIAQTGIGSLVGNIPANDVPYILEEYRFQRDMLRKAQMQFVARSQASPDSPAYKVQINENACKKRTAADILSDPDGVQKLKNAREYLAKNVARYKNNQVMIDAIDDAFALFKSGKLAGAPSTYTAPPLYKRMMKHKSTKNAAGKNLCYDISITGTAGKTNEWEFSLTNYYAFLKGTVILPDSIEGRKTCSMNVPQEEMDLFIYRLRSTMERYEAMMFRGQYEVAQKYARDKAFQNIQRRMQ